jgi:hypothetical protein
VRPAPACAPTYVRAYLRAVRARLPTCAPTYVRPTKEMENWMDSQESKESWRI